MAGASSQGSRIDDCGRAQQRQVREAEMDLRAHVIEVILNDGWKVEFRGNRFGPYPTKKDAIATAEMWAENAQKRGHQLTVIVRLVGMEDPPIATDGRGV
jgi:hypothetical protein